MKIDLEELEREATAMMRAYRTDPTLASDVRLAIQDLVAPDLLVDAPATILVLIARIRGLEAGLRVAVDGWRLRDHEQYDSDELRRCEAMIESGTVVTDPEAQYGRLRDAVLAVPKGGASGDAPQWLIDLHRAACAVLQIEVVEDGARKDQGRFGAVSP